MSESWKCCNGCRCPCNNNDICPDTVAHIMSEGTAPARSPTGNRNQSSGQSSRSPSLEDLIQLEQKIDRKLKNMRKTWSQRSDHSLPDFDLSSISSSSAYSRGPTDYELHFNEILILRKRLQEAELRNAIVEEKVLRLESLLNNGSIGSVHQINQLKEQIINFIEEKFSQFLRNFGK